VSRCRQLTEITRPAYHWPAYRRAHTGRHTTDRRTTAGSQMKDQGSALFPAMLIARSTAFSLGEAARGGRIRPVSRPAPAQVGAIFPRTDQPGQDRAEQQSRITAVVAQRSAELRATRFDESVRLTELKCLIRSPGV
jgi:hypothetical protein